MHVALLEEKSLLEAAENQYKKENHYRLLEYKKSINSDKAIEDSILI